MLVNRAHQLCFCTAGIYFCYLLYGYVQEAIYEPQVDRHQPGATVQFSYTLLLLFLQSVAGAALALAFHSAIRVFNPEYGSVVVDGVSTRKSELTVHLATRPGFTACAIAYLAAMFFSNEALKYVSYPFQSLAKSCKMIPVLISRVLVLRVRYPTSKYVVVLVMTLGISLFQGSKMLSSSGPSTEMYGVLLLLASLVLDGVCGPTQERVHREFPCSNLAFMFLNNLHAVGVLGLPLLLTHQLVEGVQFCIDYPEVGKHVLTFALLSAVGQLFIFYSLLLFDSLVLSTITTTRKFLTIVISVVFHGNVLSLVQWLAVAMVFGAIMYDAGVGSSSSTKKKRTEVSSGGHAV